MTPKNLKKDFTSTLNDSVAADNTSKDTNRLMLRLGHKFSLIVNGKVGVISVAIVSVMTIILVITANFPTV